MTSAFCLFYNTHVEQKELNMNDNRKQLVQHIVDLYTNKFTAAMFCERDADVQRYEAEANDWFRQQRVANNITGEEIAVALEAIREIAFKNGQPLGYDDELVK